MRKVINLKASKGSLILDADKNDWCRVKLSNPSGESDLGADDIEIIAARLSHALSNGQSYTCGEIDGQPVAWVMSLMEKHYTIYIGAESNTIDLFLQNSNGELFAKVSLSERERENWCSQLADFD